MDNHGVGNEHENWDEQRERLSAYIDGELSAADSQRLERHLPTCTACQRELAELQRLRALLHALPAPRLPRSFTLPETGPVPVPAAVARREREARRHASAVARVAQWMGGVAAAAGLLLVLGSALVGLSGNRSAASNGSAAMPALRSSSAPARSPAASTPGAGTGVNATDQSHPTPQPSPTQQPTASDQHAPYFAPQQNPVIESGGQSGAVPVAPLTGAGLVVAGGALMVGGRVAGRRARSRDNAG